MKPGALSPKVGDKRAPKAKRAFRNDLEEGVGSQLAAAGLPVIYEGERLPYTVPQRTAAYIPDFRVGNILLEAKGRFEGPRGNSSDGARERQKYLHIKAHYPDLDIRFVFQRAATKIYKGSPTTYGEWATDHGFLWSDKGRIPKEWITDLKREAARAAREGHRE